MSKLKQPLTKEQLKGFKKDILIDMVIALSGHLEDMKAKLDLMAERVNTLTDSQFGIKSEKKSVLDDILGPFFNEAEVIVSEASEEELKEPSGEDIRGTKDRAPHPKGKREDLLAELEQVDVPHTLDREELTCGKCGGNLVPIGKELTQRLVFQPAAFTLQNHYIYSYKCEDCETIVSADRPLSLFKGSLATPSLLSGIATAKFVNAMPFDRMEQSFRDLDVVLHKETMARWMIRIAEKYFSLIYERMKEELLSNSIIHADETTAVVSKDGRRAGAKSYMWVYTDEKGNTRW